jgi:hypothetical protein
VEGEWKTTQKYEERRGTIMSRGIEVVDEGFYVNPVHHSVFYMTLEKAAEVAKLHPQSLARLYRQSGKNDYDRAGLRLGRNVYFSDRQLKDLGYPKN